MVARGAFGANAEAEPARARAARVRRGAMVNYVLVLCNSGRVDANKNTTGRKHKATTKNKNVGKLRYLVKRIGERTGRGRREITGVGLGRVRTDFIKSRKIYKPCLIRVSFCFFICIHIIQLIEILS